MSNPYAKKNAIPKKQLRLSSNMTCYMTRGAGKSRINATNDMSTVVAPTRPVLFLTHRIRLTNNQHPSGPSVVPISRRYDRSNTSATASTCAFVLPIFVLRILCYVLEFVDVELGTLLRQR